MYSFQKKIKRHTKRPKVQFKETEQTSDPDSDIVEMLELSDWEVKTTIINMLQVLMGK